MSRATAAFDRLTGCESLAYTESNERLRERMAEAAASFDWHGVVVDWKGQQLTVEIRLDTVNSERPIATVYGLAETARGEGENYHAWRNRVAMLTAPICAAAVAKYHEERAEMERSQTDARAIAWLRERGKLVEEHGQWILK